jgi:ferredoxin
MADKYLILYFTGTGNSRYVAEKVAEKLDCKRINLNTEIKNNGTPSVDTEGVVLIAPTYAWRIPRIVQEWIKKTDFSQAKKVWFVLTCGSEIGNASLYNQRLCRSLGCAYMGTAQIIMPENYIAMFDAPDKNTARDIIKKAEPVIQRAAQAIAAGEKLPAEKDSLYYRLLSSVVNPLFYTFSVKAKAFTVDDRCIGCGKCAEKCPLKNIHLVDRKPVWGKSCTHCMACICYCPVEAVEYGQKSKGKPRYHLEGLDL